MRESKIYTLLQQTEQKQVVPTSPQSSDLNLLLSFLASFRSLVVRAFRVTAVATASCIIIRYMGSKCMQATRWGTLQ